MADTPGTRVIVGMSGGVDSSVSAWLLRQQGYQVEALFMKNWEEDDAGSYCAAAEDLADATEVCRHIGIELHTVNFSAEYWERVFELFLAGYAAGQTPNPDVICNQEIKFRAFLDHAIALGADRIATGHYARIKSSGGTHHLARGEDPDKDQSYFLYRLNQRQLASALFPLGGLRKEEVRRIARDAGLPTHDKKDSTGICFIGERPFREFLASFLPAQPGDIRTTAGEVIGRHGGVMYYTIGQRQGLGIGGRAGSSGEAWYVIGKDMQTRTLIVGQGHGHPGLFRPSLQAGQMSWIRGRPPEFPLACSAKTRYRQADQACTVTAAGEGRCRVDFQAPQRAVTPGQSVVFYTGDTCLGGGIIEDAATGDSPLKHGPARRV